MSHSGKLYEDLAVYYDRFCAEVDYPQQSAFVARAFAALAASDGRVHLDLACGTGQHLQALQELGFVSSGLDNSAAMLAQAALRCPTAELLLCDLAAFEQVACYDLITCLLYSIHYSHPTTALQETLRRAWRALKPGGLFLFNVVDARGISNDSGITTQVMDGDSVLSFQSGWQYSGQGERLNLALRITRETAAGSQHWQDRHTMTALTLPQLQGMLEQTGFMVELFEHDYTRLCRWDGQSFNVLVAASRPVPAG
jgi:SAM-dependent methyltransferase